MRQAWERFAAEDPQFFTVTAEGDWSAGEYLLTGKRGVDAVMRWIEPALHSRERMLEIGCGLGRTTISFAEHFDRVDGVDISPGMLRQARERGLPPNVGLTLTSGADLQPFTESAFDFVFSALVFQHVHRASVIQSYLGEIRRVLRPHGRALLQFDTRPRSRLAQLAYVLPDALLPTNRRRYVRRYRRDPAWLRETLVGAGLGIEEERGQGGSQHWFLLRPH